MEMRYLGFLVVSVFSWKVSAQTPPIERILTNYFNSQSVRSFWSTWENHRALMEYAIRTVMGESVGIPETDICNWKIKQKLGVGYMHDDHKIKVIFNNFEHKYRLRFRNPSATFSLASNVLKIQTKLTHMSIYANYSLLRNRNDTIYGTDFNSPFQFFQVKDSDNIWLWAKNCTLSGFIITTLGGDPVGLGYDYFKLSDCEYHFEIYTTNRTHGEIKKKNYNLNREDDAALPLIDLILRPLLMEELRLKLQAALLIFVKSSAMGSSFTEYRDNLEIVFQNTTQYMAELIRNLNRITNDKNAGEIYMEDYTFLWDEDKKHMYQPEKIVQLTGMTLWGLNSMYSAHSGGPFKMDDKIMIAEEIRFSSLQVSGSLYVISDPRSNVSEQPFVFASEITDLAIDIHLAGESWKKVSTRVNGLSRITFSSTIPHVFVEELVGAYLLNEVSRVIHSYLMTIIPEAIHRNRI